MELGGEQLVLRPSMCPHHAVMFRSRARSYRELPLRMAELGGQYRSELSGVLGGLTRVRGMQLNDAHIFCTLDQVAAEAASALAMIRQAHQALGIEPARYRLSLAGESAKYVGSATDVGRRHLDAARRPGRQRHRLRHQGGRGGVLRPQDRRPGGRQRRARGQHRDRADRLLPAGALRPGVHRPGRRPASPGHGAPQRHRQRRARRRASARRPRRRVPALASPRPARRPAHFRRAARPRPWRLSSRRSTGGCEPRW